MNDLTQKICRLQREDRGLDLAQAASDKAHGEYIEMVTAFTQVSTSKFSSRHPRQNLQIPSRDSKSGSLHDINFMISNVESADGILSAANRAV
jgi:hypothetical protein